MKDISPMTVGLLFAALPSFAQPADESPLSGSISLGIRSVEVTGAATKFREDVNLDDGVRLLDLAVSYAPSSDSNSMIDWLEVDASNLGGDPFESIHLGVRKYGAYNLKLDRRRSEYFYEDTILPAALASVNGSTGGDFHHFDFARVRDTASLEIDLSPETKLSFGLDRQTRTGNSTTTLDIQRDEFELDRPLDESLNAATFGVQHAWDRVTVIFEEELRDFENSSQLFLPGASAGENTADLSELQFFRLDQSYDYDSRSHLLRVVADPAPRFNLQAALRREDLNLDMRAMEQSLGTDFTGAPFSTDLTGPTVVGRDLDFNEVDFGFTINDRVRVIGGTRTSALAQSGSLLFGTNQGAADWTIDTDGFELGVEFAALPNLIVSAGFTTEERDTSYRYNLNAAAVVEHSETERDGSFARLLFKTSQGLELTASIEDNSIDNPFTLASPTGNQRYKTSVRQRWDNGLSLTGTYRRTDVENDNSGWAADTEQADIRVTYQRERLQLSAGYTSVDLKRNINQLVQAGSRADLFSIAYSADAELSDVSARWRVNDKIAIGGNVRSYDNRGSFSLARDDLRAFIDFDLNASYTLQASYRDIEYLEDVFDDYDAELLELAIRLKW